MDDKLDTDKHTHIQRKQFEAPYPRMRSDMKRLFFLGTPSKKISALRAWRASFSHGVGEVNLRYGVKLAKSSSISFRIKLNLQLIGQNINHQAGILRNITKIYIQQRIKKILIWSSLVENRNSITGVCAPRHGMFYVTEAGHGNWCHVVG